MKHDLQTLENNLRLVTVPMSSVQSATVLILVGTGSRYETKNINGISHFLEHMVYKGTKKRPNAIDIPAEIEGIGGSWNAFTSKDHTGFYIKAANTHLTHMFDILSDVLLHSVLKEEEIEKEKGVIVEEIHMYEDMPIQKVSEVYDELVFGDQPIGWDIAGTPEIVRSFDRTTFVDYWTKHYVPSNMVIAVAGGVNIHETKTLASKFMGSMKDRKAGSALPAKVVQSGPRVKIKHKKTEQAHLCLGVPSYPLGHPDRYNLGLMTAILGAGASSRLFDEIREKRGYAYYCRASNDQYTDVGNFVTQSGLVLQKVDDAVKVILEQFHLLSTGKRPVEKKELDRSKELLKGHLILSLEDSKNVAGHFGTDELIEGKMQSPEEIIKKIDSVKAEDIERVAKDLFTTNKLNLAVIGPFEEPDRFKTLLHV